MARPLRLEVPNGIYHVTARANGRGALYRSASDRRRFLGILADTCGRYHWLPLGYCLMGTHYHLLVRTPLPNLARGMRDLNGIYAQTFNRRHGRVGHLFQGRYGAILVEANEHLFAVIRYIARNPVEAGLSSTPADWPWSSHRAALGIRPPGVLAVDALLDCFSPERTHARRLYQELTEQTDADASPLPSNGVILGSDEFVSSHLLGVDSSPEIPAAHTRLPRPPLGELLADGGSLDALAAAYGHGYTMPAIADHLGLHPSTVSRRLSRLRAQIKT